MWLTNSSIGRKVIMSVTGMALVLFLLFHASMNVVALFSKDGYNMICEFLGANWYCCNYRFGSPVSSPHRVCIHPYNSEPQGTR